MKKTMIIDFVCVCGHDINFHNALDNAQCHAMNCNCKQFVSKDNPTLADKEQKDISLFAKPPDNSKPQVGEKLIWTTYEILTFSPKILNKQWLDAEQMQVLFDKFEYGEITFSQLKERLGLK